MKRRVLKKRYGRAVKPPMPDMSWLYGGPTGSLHDRAAAALGWPLADTQSMSLQSLREVVRPLAGEMDRAIRSGSYIVGERRRRR